MDDKCEGLPIKWVKGNGREEMSRREKGRLVWIADFVKTRIELVYLANVSYKISDNGAIRFTVTVTTKVPGSPVRTFYHTLSEDDPFSGLSHEAIADKAIWHISGMIDHYALNLVKRYPDPEEVD